MTRFLKLVKRNVKLFFQDKGLFFTSLITPLILLVLYGTFLGNIFKDSYTQSVPEGISVPPRIIAGLVSGQLFASILAVSCVTVAFCSNMLMVQDKITGARKDLLISPLKKHTLALSYFAATFIITLTICFFACAICFVYTAIVGWYFSVADVLLILADVFVLTLFGTLLSSIVNGFLETQGQLSAVGTIVSSVYGFICGAYMPIATFGKGLQNVMSFLPSTYGTSLIKNHTMRGALSALTDAGMPTDAIMEIKRYNDLSLSFFGGEVSTLTMFLIIFGTVLLLLGIYVAINLPKNKKTEAAKNK